MFVAIRLVISCVLLGILIFAIKKSKMTYKRILYLVSTIIFVMLISTLMFLPFENIFLSFDSPTAAYEYSTLGKSNIDLVIEGKNCDMIVDRKNGTDVYLIIPKTADGWKVGIGADTKRIVQRISNGVIIYVYQYKNSNDYFITILDTKGGVANITDGYNTKFASLNRNNNSSEETIVTYYAHISTFNTKYSVIVNGNKIILNNQ